MIALDAAVLIAFRNPDDAHHVAAKGLLSEHAGRSLVISPITKAETLVDPIRHGALPAALALMDALGVEVTPLPPEAAERLARLRVETGAKMPDCCVLLAAQQAGAAVATFDQRLARQAKDLGLSVLP